MDGRRKGNRKTMIALVLSFCMLWGAVSTAQAEDGVYTVKKGDNLSKIAKEAYGDKNGWKVIYEANKSIMKNANTLHIGQQLILPGAPATEEIPVVTEDIPAPADASAADETPAVAEIPAVSGQGIVAEEGVPYRLNTWIEWIELQNGASGTMGGMDVSFSRNDIYEFNYDYYDFINSYSVPGYGWRHVDVTYEPTMDGSLYWNWSINVNGTDNWMEIDTDYPTARVINFTLHYNGVDYTDCKCIIITDGDEYSTRVQWVGVLVPQDFNGMIQYKIYGSDGENRIETEYVNIVF